MEESATSSQYSHQSQPPPAEPSRERGEERARNRPFSYGRDRDRFNYIQIDSSHPPSLSSSIRRQMNPDQIEEYRSDVATTPSNVVFLSVVTPPLSFHFSVSSPFNNSIFDDCFHYIIPSLYSTDEDYTTTNSSTIGINIGPSDISSDTTSIHQQSFYVTIAVCVLLCILILLST